MTRRAPVKITLAVKLLMVYLHRREDLVDHSLSQIYKNPKPFGCGPVASVPIILIQAFADCIPGISSKYQESPHPIFWVEAYNDAVQKWIPVDPFVTKTVAKASKFEP